MKFIKQSPCSSCRRTAIIYKSEEGFVFHCFNCGKHLKEVDPTLYKDMIRGSMMAILKRLRPNEDIEKKIPETAVWQDILVTILGIIDVNNLENERFRKFFKENHQDNEPQLSFFHMLKRVEE